MTSSYGLPKIRRAPAALLPLLLPALLFAQPSVYLRSSGPTAGYIAGASNTSPIVLAVSTTGGLAAGDIVGIMGVAASDSHGSCAASDPHPPYNVSSANGIRKIKQIIDRTHFSIADLDGKDIAANGVWCRGGIAGSWPGGAQIFGKLHRFQLAAGQPRGMFDGLNGTVTRHWALGTANGMVSLVVDRDHRATVTTRFNHDVLAGDPITIWDSTSTALNNGNEEKDRKNHDYTVVSVTPTTYTFKVASAVPPGDYTSNPHCGPGTKPEGIYGDYTISGTENCVRVSQFAVAANGPWMYFYPIISSKVAPANYQATYDGGTQIVSFGLGLNAEFAPLFLVDPANQGALNALLYALDRTERVAGVNFSAVQTYNDGGTSALSDFASVTFIDLGMIYSAASKFLTPAHKRAHLNKVYNDISDPKPCVPTAASKKMLAEGVARGGNGTSITLAASDSRPDNYYVNNIIEATIQGAPSYGLVTSYSGASKTATVKSWSRGAPAAGTPYAIYATISRDRNTITGYNTSFTKDLSSGDMIYGTDGWDVRSPSQTGSYVSAIHSDTSLTVTNGYYVDANQTPSEFWYTHKWNDVTNTDCGLKWIQNHWLGAAGSQPLQYPPRGGSATGGGAGEGTSAAGIGGNNGYRWSYGRTLYALATADDDPRAVKLLADTQMFYFDAQLNLLLEYTTGYAQSGTNYSYDNVTFNGAATAWNIQHSVIGYPSMDTSGPWVTNLSILDMYILRPDNPFFQGSHTRLLMPYGLGGGDTAYIFPYGLITPQYAPAHGMAFAPTALSSRLLKSFENKIDIWTPGFLDGNVTIEGAVKIDPRIAPKDYTTQPTQYYFGATSNATCAALTGWICNPNFRADVVISRTGWTNPADTIITNEARSCCYDYDLNGPGVGAGVINIWKTGSLIGSDQLPPGGHTNSPDVTISASAIQFGGVNTFLHKDLIAFISRWASADHSSWDPHYGDSRSRYAYSMSDLSGAYAAGYRHVYRHFVHFKKRDTEEIVMVFDDVDASNAPTEIATHWHFPQNGETVAKQGVYVIYDEGNTTFSNGTVVERESGLTANDDPPHVYNLMARFFSPSPITVRDDGSTYPKSNGQTHRVSICGGSSCGATVRTFEELSVFKIARQPDTTLTAKALNPDANWTGVETADKVALFARHGQVYGTIAGFTTTHARPAQYLVAGLAPGTYTVTVNGAAVAGSPFTVSANDNTVYFESAAGQVRISR